MAGNTLTLDFAGDASKLQAAAKQADRAIEDVGGSATASAKDMQNATDAGSRYSRSLGDLGSATSGAIDSIDTLGGGLQAVADVQDYARDRAQRLARANVDVAQATEDMAQATRDANQAVIDSEQAALDLTQARLDEKTALDEYNAAVKEHGKNSDEARQAQIDLKQAGIDVKQALEDQEQATRDAAQANIDAAGAQVDLADAMHEANPPDLQTWADQLNLVTPLLTAMIGITSLVTAAQWLWNAAQLASPTTWIILGIVALIAIIVLLVKNWDKVAAAAGKAWDWIKTKASDTWDYLKKIPGRIADSFGQLADTISRPFRSAFNQVADAWNNTVGSLSWTIPDWVPGLGGNTISAPRLPRFHSGGTVPGPAGSEVLAVLQAGEEVTSRSEAGRGGTVHVTVQLDRDTLIEGVAYGVRRRGGDVQMVLGGANA